MTASSALNPAAQPLVSVLLPVHNGGVFLQEAVTSILEQTWNDFEIVAVENGSTDGSLDILQQFAEVDGRVRVIEAGPVGLVAALNLGVGAATGRYLARMDADDVAEPQRLETQVAYLRGNPSVGVVGTAHDYIDAVGTTVGFRRFVTSPGAVAASLYFGNPLAHPTVMIDRDRTGTIEFPTEFPDAEDLALWRTLSLAGVGLGNVADVLLHYRVHADSVTAKDDALVGHSDVDALVASSRWPRERSRWAISRTYNRRARAVSWPAFLGGIMALNLLNLRVSEVPRRALLLRSLLALAAGVPRPCTPRR